MLVEQEAALCVLSEAELEIVHFVLLFSQCEVQIILLLFQLSFHLGRRKIEFLRLGFGRSLRQVLPACTQLFGLALCFVDLAALIQNFFCALAELAFSGSHGLPQHILLNNFVAEGEVAEINVAQPTILKLRSFVGGVPLLLRGLVLAALCPQLKLGDHGFFLKGGLHIRALFLVQSCFCVNWAIRLHLRLQRLGSVL